ncbi:hypothetical protein D3C87_1371910 [compost metagenome]
MMIKGCLRSMYTSIASHMREIVPSGSMRVSEPAFTLPSSMTISFFRVGLANVARCAVKWSPRCVA